MTILAAGVAIGVMSSKIALVEALTKFGFSNIASVKNLGYVGWSPPLQSHKAYPYRCKSIRKATVDEVRRYTVPDALPSPVVPASELRLPLSLATNIRKQTVPLQYPFGNIGVAALCHAKSRGSDLSEFDFYFGCSALEILCAEKKTSKRYRKANLIMKVPATNIIMLRTILMFAQDYTLPGFQFERLMTGKGLTDRHDVGLTEHVQVMRIGNYSVLMSAEVDAADQDGNPVELKLRKGTISGVRRIFFQMIGSGSRALHQGEHEGGVLNSVQVIDLEDMAVSMSKRHDASSLESNIIRNMDRIKEWDHQGFFDDGKVYRIDFNPQMELNLVNQTLLPPAAVVEELLG